MSVFLNCHCGKKTCKLDYWMWRWGLLLWENIAQNGNCRAIFSDHASIVRIVIAIFINEKNTKYSKKREKFWIHLVYNCLNNLLIFLLSLYTDFITVCHSWHLLGILNSNFASVIIESSVWIPIVWIFCNREKVQK